MFRGYKGTHRIVHQNQFHIIRHQLQRLGYRPLPRVPAFNHAHRLHEFLPADALLQLGNVFLARGNDNVGHLGTGGNPAQADDHDGHTIEFKKLLRRLRAHASAETSRRKNSGYFPHNVIADRLKRYLAGQSAGCRRESVPQREGGGKQVYSSSRLVTLCLSVSLPALQKFEGGEVGEGLVGPDTVVGLFPLAELSVEYFGTVRVCADLIKLFVVGTVGALHVTVELRRFGWEHEQGQVSQLASFFKFSRELAAAVDLQRFDREWQALEQCIQEVCRRQGSCPSMDL